MPPRKNSVLLAFVPVLIYFSTQFAVQIIVESVYLMRYILENPVDLSQQDAYAYIMGQPSLFMFASLIAALITALLLALLGKKLFRRSREENLKTSLFHFGRLHIGHVIGLFCSGLFVVYLVNLLITNTSLYSLYEQTSETILTSMSPYLLLNLSSLTIMTPIAEELVFRTGMHEELKKHLSLWGSILLSSFFFGILHGNFVQGLYAMLLGVILCVVYEKFSSVWASIFVHAGFNCLSVLPVGSMILEYAVMGLSFLGFLYLGFVLFKSDFPKGNTFNASKPVSPMDDSNQR